MLSVLTAVSIVFNISRRAEIHQAPYRLADTTVRGGDTAPQTPRLTVRPRDMATGTRTSQAGLTSLDGLPGYWLYVPRQCVGTQRSPLILLLHGGGRTGAQEIEKFQGLADTYGMIVLAANAVEPGLWDVMSGGRGGKRAMMKSENGFLVVSAFPERDVRNIDTALTRVLRTHAIDPNRIAVLGFSNGGSYAMFVGLSNLDIFSRIAALSAMLPYDGLGPRNPATQIFLSGGMGEGPVPKRTLRLAGKLRERGHAVMTQIGLRGHVDYVEDEFFVWDWLQKSWADPTVTTRVTPEVVSDPVLTEQVLQQMITFWTRFQEQPDSIRKVLRMQHQMQISMTVGSEQTTVITMNLPTMAAASPVVAALLDSVGLTAQTATAYRTALIRTRIARLTGMTPGELPQASDAPFAPIDPASSLGRNLEFWQTHEAMLFELEMTGMWKAQ